MSQRGSRSLPDRSLHLGIFLALLLQPLFLATCSAFQPLPTDPKEPDHDRITRLPEPSFQGPLSLEETLTDRRSVREFSDRLLGLPEISQLLWAAQGITDPRGFRTAPSAGALYPLDVYLLTPEGVFHYEPRDHLISLLVEGDKRVPLSQAALSQRPIMEAPLILVITAAYERTQAKYGPERSPRYVHLEAGHAAQNVLLQAVSLDLGAVPIGAFHDREVQDVLNLPADHMPLYLIPVGHPK